MTKPNALRRILAAVAAVALLVPLATTVERVPAQAQAAAPGYVQSNFANANDGNGGGNTGAYSITIPLTATVAADTVLTIGLDNGPDTFAAPSGSPFAPIGSRITNATNNGTQTPFSESGTSITSSVLSVAEQGGYGAMAAAFEFSGVGSITPGAMFGTAAATSIQCPSATVTALNSVVLYFVDVNTKATNYATATNGYTLLKSGTASNGNGYNSFGAFVSGAQSSSGTLSGPLVTYTGNSQPSCVAYVIAPGSSTSTPTTAPTTAPTATPIATATPTATAAPTAAPSGVGPVFVRAGTGQSSDGQGGGATGAYTTTPTLSAASSATDSLLLLGIDNGSDTFAPASGSPFAALGSRQTNATNAGTITAFTETGTAVTSATLNIAESSGYPISALLDYSGVGSISLGTAMYGTTGNGSTVTGTIQCPATTVTTLYSMIVYVAQVNNHDTSFTTSTTGFTTVAQGVTPSTGYDSYGVFDSAVQTTTGSLAGPAVSYSGGASQPSCTSYVLTPSGTTPAPTPAPTASPTLAPLPTPVATALTPYPVIPPAATASPGYGAKAWVTTSDGTSQGVPLPASALAAGTTSGATTITVTPTTTYQTWAGVGGALTDTTAYNLCNLTPTARLPLMQALFTPFVGAGTQFVRVTIGSSDLSPSLYSLDDNGGGGGSTNADPSLGAETLSADDPCTVPMLQQALLVNPSLRVMLSPWSPPAWMKTPAVSTGSNAVPNPAYYNQLASYLVRAVQMFEQRGVPVWALTLQNEPQTSPGNYPGMLVTEPVAATIIGSYLGPQLASAGLRAPHVVNGVATQVRFLGYDHNQDNLVSYGGALLGDPTAGPYLDGTAVHCYSAGSSSSIATLLSQYPSKPVYETECSATTGAGSTSNANGDSLASQFGSPMGALADINYGASSVLYWSMAQNATFGPNTGGCGTCVGYVTIPASGNVTKNFNFGTSALIADMADLGATRIAVSQPNGETTTAFADPNGTTGVLVYNTTSAAITNAIAMPNGYAVSVSVPAGGAVTVRLGPTATLAALGVPAAGTVTTISQPAPASGSRIFRRY